MYAGFSKHEDYFVPRMHIKKPYKIEQYCEFLFGASRYRMWLQEQRGPDGDKGECWECFLYKIIPYLVETLVTDGIHFIIDYPDHSIAIYLTTQIPHCKEFCTSAREEEEYPH